MTRFRRYKNKYTNSEIIHSIEDVIGMPFGDVVDRERELESQYSQIGIPTNAELKASPNAVYVEGYTKSDGTVVKSHWRSRGDSVSDYVGNVPSYTDGIYGKGVPTVAAQEPNQTSEPKINGYIDEKGNVISVDENGNKQVMPKQNENGDYIFYDITDVGNPYPKEGAVFTKVPDKPEKESSEGISKGKRILDGLKNILTNMKPVKIDNISEPNVVVENRENAPINLKSTNIEMIPVKNDVETVKPVIEDINTSAERPVQMKNAPVFNLREKQAGKYQVMPDITTNQTPVNETNNVVSFEEAKKISGRKIEQPMASHSGAEMNEYLSKERKNPVKDFGKGLVHGISSIFEGIERRKSKNDNEIKNKYGKVVGLPSESGMYDFGEFVSEVLLLMAIPIVTIESFPLIVAFMLNAAIQILGSTAIDYARYENDKKFTDELIDHSANYILMEFLSRGLVKATDKGKVFDHLKRKLYELWKKIKESKVYKRLQENSAIPIVQKDGTIVLKKAGLSGDDRYYVNRKPERFAISLSEFERHRLQAKLLKKNRRSGNMINNASDIKSFKDFNSSLKFKKMISNYTYKDYLEVLNNKIITIYSHEPIELGAIITPSKQAAKNLARDEHVYEKIVPLNDIVWTGVYTGHYVPVEHMLRKISDIPLKYKSKYVKVINKCYEIELPVNEAERITHNINTDMQKIVELPKNKYQELEYSDVEYIYKFINIGYGKYIYIGKELNNVTRR